MTELRTMQKTPTDKHALTKAIETFGAAKASGNEGLISYGIALVNQLLITLPDNWTAPVVSLNQAPEALPVPESPTSE